MVSLGPTGPYRKNAGSRKEMSVSDVAKQIEKIYSKRLNTSSISINLRFVTYSDGDSYRAALSHDNREIASSRSDVNFEEAINTLARQLDV